MTEDLLGEWLESQGVVPTFALAELDRALALLSTSQEPVTPSSISEAALAELDRALAYPSVS